MIEIQLVFTAKTIEMKSAHIQEGMVSSIHRFWQLLFQTMRHEMETKAVMVKRGSKKKLKNRTARIGDDKPLIREGRYITDYWSFSFYFLSRFFKFYLLGILEKDKKINIIRR